jgi:hypothetical protein
MVAEVCIYKDRCAYIRIVMRIGTQVLDMVAEVCIVSKEVRGRMQRDLLRSKRDLVDIGIPEGLDRDTEIMKFSTIVLVVAFLRPYALAVRLFVTAEFAVGNLQLATNRF